MALMTAALFIVSEPAAGQIVEPLVYGQHTGLSPVAVVLSTLFWTLLWGPIGLLLATPLTVCLVVLGKHIEGLRFINVLLGDEPPLLPEERFYQRLLADDATDAADQAEEELKTQSLSAYYDAIPMKALVLAQGDAAEGKLTSEKQQTIRDTVNEIIEVLSDYQDTNPGPKRKLLPTLFRRSPNRRAAFFASPVAARSTRQLPPCWHKFWKNERSRRPCRRSKPLEPPRRVWAMWPMHNWFACPISDPRLSPPTFVTKFDASSEPCHRLAFWPASGCLAGIQQRWRIGRSPLAQILWPHP
jgi:hypothetical protein